MEAVRIREGVETEEEVLTGAAIVENGIKIQLGMIKKLIDLGEENQAEETKERIIQKMKDKTDTIIDEALEPTEIQNF